MNRKVIFIIVLVVTFFTVSYFNLLNTNNIKTNADDSLINNVIEIEKNLALTQFRRISFEEFRDNTINYFHQNYVDSYFDERESLYNSGWLSASALPVYIYISNVYTSENEKNKYVFVRLSEEKIANQAAFIYNFVIDNDTWKIVRVHYYTLSKDMKMPENDVKKFTNFDGIPIDYEFLKILD